MAQKFSDHIRLCKIHQVEKQRENNSYKFVCKICAQERTRQWREKNKERYQTGNKEQYLKRKALMEEARLQGKELFIEKESDIECHIHNIKKIYAADNGLICRECKKEYAKRYRQKNPGKRYGLTFDQFMSLYENADNKCEICRKPESRMINEKVVRLCVDHKHDESEKVRGILCVKCNALLGHANESIETLQKAIEYLKRHEHRASNENEKDASSKEACTT